MDAFQEDAMNSGFELRYLSASDVARCLPPLERQLELAEHALLALAQGDVEMPPKPVLEPRQEAFLHPMAAWLRKDDLLGLKWVSGYASNQERGLPYIMGLIVLNDADTGRPLCVMDCTVVTAVRTADVTGVALKRFAKRSDRKVTLVGAGIQGRSHLPVLTSCLDSPELIVVDRWPDRAEAYVEWAIEQPGVASARAESSLKAAVAEADVVITAGTAHGVGGQFLTPNLLPSQCLLIPIDWNLMVPPETAMTASWLVVDDRDEFEYYRFQDVDENFSGFPPANETIGDAVARPASPESRPDGLVLVCPLGAAVVDVVLASAVYESACEQEIGVPLPLQMIGSTPMPTSSDAVFDRRTGQAPDPVVGADAGRDAMAARRRALAQGGHGMSPWQHVKLEEVSCVKKSRPRLGARRWRGAGETMRRRSSSAARVVRPSDRHETGLRPVKGNSRRTSGQGGS
jgi:ornithine cyclodeaminase/alanine dehydrogenase-like protein (mu-crystallin family)